jgi:hypothetical protein
MTVAEASKASRGEWNGLAVKQSEKSRRCPTRSLGGHRSSTGRLF